MNGIFFLLPLSQCYYCLDCDSEMRDDSPKLEFLWYEVNWKMKSSDNQNLMVGNGRVVDYEAYFYSLFVFIHPVYIFIH